MFASAKALARILTRSVASLSDKPIEESIALHLLGALLQQVSQSSSVEIVYQLCWVLREVFDRPRKATSHALLAEDASLTDKLDSVFVVFLRTQLLPPNATLDLFTILRATILTNRHLARSTARDLAARELLGLLHWSLAYLYESDDRDSETCTRWHATIANELPLVSRGPVCRYVFRLSFRLLCGIMIWATFCVCARDCRSAMPSSL